ncbi:MAG: hypothetical protein ABW005_08275 [Burkholderiaceae bacterium]
MLRTTLLSCALLLAGGLAHAADTADKTDSAAAKLPPVKPGWTLLPGEVPDAKIERIVNEDDSARIEELRVRGQVQKVTVHLKNSVFPDYEIQMSDGERELPASRFVVPSGSAGGTIGKRVWRVLDF